MLAIVDEYRTHNMKIKENNTHV